MTEIQPAPEDTPKKSKRTGKSRQLAKERAILAAAEAKTKAEVQAKQVDDNTKADTSSAVEAALPATSEGSKTNEPISNRKKRKRAESNTEAVGAEPIVAEGAEGSSTVKAETDNHDPVEGDEEKVEEEEDGVFKPDLEAIQKRIPQALKSLLPILKKSSTTETQRIIKKIKFLRKKIESEASSSETIEMDSKGKKEEMENEVKDLTAQFEGMKKLNLPSLLLPLIQLKLNKHPLLKPSLPFPPSFFPSPSTATPSASSSSSSDPILQTKLENKLYSSKSSTDGIKRIVSWTIGEPGIKLRPKSLDVIFQAKNAERDRIRKEEEEKRRGKGMVMNQERLRVLAARGDGAVPGEDEDEDDDDARVDVPMDEDVDEAGWESGSVSGGEYEGIGGGGMTLGNSDDESSDEDDVVVEDEEDQNPAPNSTKVSDQPPSKKLKALPTTTLPPPSSSSKSTKPQTGPITSSLFLPSLNTGYVPARDGEFDPDEDDKRENKKAGLNAKGERKNRRGQQERRAIWEKKYGGGANHVKAAKLVESTTQKFENAQGGAVANNRWGGASSGAAVTAGRPIKTDSRLTGAGHKTQVDRPSFIGGSPAGIKPSTGTVPSKTATTPAGDVAKEKEKALHPSWEAARLRKEKEAAMALAKATVKPKKIIFD